MRIQKTISVVLGIFLSAFLAYILGYHCGLVLQCELFYLPYLLGHWAGDAVIALALALALAAVCWLMLVWDAGDKIPPAIMLIAGLLGIAIYLLNMCADLYRHSFFWLGTFSYPMVMMVSSLYFAFGTAGLLLKPKPK